MVYLHCGREVVVPGDELMRGLVSVGESGDVTEAREGFHGNRLDMAVGLGLRLGPSVQRAGSGVLGHGLTQVERFAQGGDG